MLKTIADVSPQLVAFVLALLLSLSCHQLQHVTQATDALITTEGNKMLSALYRNAGTSPFRDNNAKLQSPSLAGKRHSLASS